MAARFTRLQRTRSAVLHGLLVLLTCLVRAVSSVGRIIQFQPVSIEERKRDLDLLSKMKMSTFRLPVGKFPAWYLVRRYRGCCRALAGAHGNGCNALESSFSCQPFPGSAGADGNSALNQAGPFFNTHSIVDQTDESDIFRASTQQMEGVVFEPEAPQPQHVPPDWLAQCASFVEQLEEHMCLPCCNMAVLEAFLDQVRRSRSSSLTFMATSELVLVLSLAVVFGVGRFHANSHWLMLRSECLEQQY